MTALLLFLNSLTSAQTQGGTDTLSAQKHGKDSTAQAYSFPLSKDRITHALQYQAKDSLVYNAVRKQLHLYEAAHLNYDEIQVQADEIIYEQDSNRLTAKVLPRENRDTTDKPKLTQGSESSTFSLLQFNFKTKRALIENAYSQYGEGFILSKRVKRNNDSTISGLQNIYTTCNDPHPHFGIATRKVRIIPDKVAVTGPANLVVEDIPTPLVLPFGMFPLQKGQRSGFKLPTYDMSEKLGFGLREFGYYFAIGPHLDLLANADLYALGTYRVGFISNYLYRYRFGGMFSFNYSYTKIGEPYEAGSQRLRNYSLVWNHRLQQQVIPGASFSASVNIINNRNYQIYNTYDANTYLNNNYSSAISFTKSWTGKPYNLSVALRHNQNTQTHQVQVTLPDVAFNINQVFPFQFRKDIIKPKWYEKIGASYQFSALNRLDFYDTSFHLNTVRGSDFQNGFKHTVPVNANYHILKFINLNAGFLYDEYWFTRRNMKWYNFQDQRLDTVKNTGFFTARDFSFNTSLSTRIYGIKLFKKGAIRGIRHVLTPSVNFRYQPDFGSGIGHYYYNTIIDSNFNHARYSYYEGGLLGVPPDGRFGGINFALGNTLQLKVRNRKDTLNGTKKVNLIDGLDFSGSYNFVVDSFKWSPMSMRYRTTLFENIAISGALNYDPYAIDKTTGRRTRYTYWETDGKLLRFTSADIALHARLPLKKQNTALNKATDEQKQALGNSYAMYADFNIPWHLDLNYTASLQKQFQVLTQHDSLVLTQNLLFNGDVNLTLKWRVGLSSGYDFKNKKLTYTSFDVFRDLHCWEMRLNLIPFGPRKSYNFALNVKSSVLQDLKLVRRKDFRDNL